MRICVTPRARVHVADAYRVTRVVVLVDGRRVRSTARTRFTVRLSARHLRAGRHTLRVTVLDSRGRRASRTTRFTRCAPPAPPPTPRFTG